jgi:hypothetical protein
LSASPVRLRKLIRPARPSDKSNRAVSFHRPKIQSNPIPQFMKEQPNELQACIRCRKP